MSRRNRSARRARRRARRHGRVVDITGCRRSGSRSARSMPFGPLGRDQGLERHHHRHMAHRQRRDRGAGCAPPICRAMRSPAPPRAPIRSLHRPGPTAGGGSLRLADEPARLELGQPLGQHVGADSREVGLELGEAARPVSQLAQHQHRPAFADQVQRMGEAAGVVVSPFLLVRRVLVSFSNCMVAIYNSVRQKASESSCRGGKTPCPG